MPFLKCLEHFVEIDHLLNMSKINAPFQAMFSIFICYRGVTSSIFGVKGYNSGVGSHWMALYIKIAD